MILTNCAACAAPLAHNAPRCVRCKTRYCNKTCQHDHWRRGHKQICKKIHRGGNAEQYHADKKYKEAVAEAVEACADDTKGHVHAREGRLPVGVRAAVSPLVQTPLSFFPSTPRVLTVCNWCYMQLMS